MRRKSSNVIPFPERRRATPAPAETYVMMQFKDDTGPVLETPVTIAEAFEILEYLAAKG
jgi:hypothetical protein